jgi:hypothetical protein
MEAYQYDDFSITLKRRGANRFTKVSYPIRYGRFSEINTRDYIFQFNLNGEIKYIQDNKQRWQYPGEWLKRSVADEWTYYSAAGYGGTYSFIGEYYLPCFSQPKNAISSTYIFDQSAADHALSSFEKFSEKLKALSSDKMPREVKKFLKCVAENDLDILKRKGREFHSIINGRITVLPPDSRHVDYEVIPVVVADGCLYNCGFCSIKTGKDFVLRSKKEIINQINNLKKFYKDDICNYNSIFLGMHDALNAGRELIEFSAENAYQIFKIEHSNMKDPKLFLFGSVDSLLDASENLFETINKMPFYTYINIGMESSDQQTLDLLKKPVSAKKVERSFDRMLDINKRYGNVEITANFVMGEGLPEAHFDSISNLTAGRLDHFFSKGCIYLSPLSSDRSTKDLQRKFVELKNISRLPTFVYLIQRL